MGFRKRVGRGAGGREGGGWKVEGYEHGDCDVVLSIFLVPVEVPVVGSVLVPRRVRVQGQGGEDGVGENNAEDLLGPGRGGGNCNRRG